MQFNVSGKRQREQDSSTLSQTAKKMSGGDSIKDLTQQMEALAAMVNSMNTKLDKLVCVNNPLIEVKSTMDQQKIKIDSIEGQMVIMENENKQQKLQVNNMQVAINKRNMVFKDITSINDTDKSFVEFCKSKFKIDVKNDKIRSVKSNKILIVTLLYEKHVDLILKNKKVRKDTGIVIHRYLPNNQREEKICCSSLNQQ